MDIFDLGSAYAGNPAQTSPAAGHAGAGHNGAAQAPSNDLFSSLDADMRSFAENKGWHRDQNPIGAVLKSYRELESRLGGAMPLPARDDEQGLRKLYAKIGMPDSPDAYALNLPEQHNAEVVGLIRDLFHEVGLTQNQASAIYDGYMDLSAPYLNSVEQAKRDEAADAKAAEKELGPAGVTAARNAFRRFMTDPGDRETMKKLMGSGRMMRFFASLAQVTGEDGKGALGIGSGAKPGLGGSGPGGKYTFSDIIREAFANTNTP